VTFSVLVAVLAVATTATTLRAAMDDASEDAGAGSA
jgi:hypothetical protein